MATPKTPSFIDGYSSVQAVRRSGRSSQGVRTRPSSTKLPERQPAPPSRSPAELPAARIGHTIVPARFDIQCYECGYAYTLQGQIHNTICPKCHKTLDKRDYTIDGPWSAPVRTIGNIALQAGGILKGAALLGRDVLLAGDAREGSVEARGHMEIVAGAKVDLARLVARDLLIGKGVVLAMAGKCACSRIVVEGELEGKVHVDGTLCVRAGGVLRGEIVCPHLVVEDGAGLVGSVASGGAAG